MAFDLSPEDEARFWADLQQREARMNEYRLTAAANPDIAVHLADIHNAAPEAAPGVKLALAQAVTAGVTPKQQAIAAAMSTYIHDVPAGIGQPIRGSRPGFWSTAGHDVWNVLTHLGPDTRPPPEGAPAAQTKAFQAAKPNPFEVLGQTQAGAAVNRDVITPALQTGPGRVLTGTVRTQIGVAQSGGQLLGSGLLQLTKPPYIAPEGTTAPRWGPAGQDPLTLAKSTTLGQQVADIATTGTSDQGQGFFPGGQAEIRRRQAERAVRGVVPGTEEFFAPGHPIPGTGSTQTIGRMTALAVTEPNTTAYRTISGAVDAAALWYLDPTTLALKGVAEARAARRLLVPAEALSAADMARVLRPGEQIVENPRLGRGVWRDVMSTPKFVPEPTLAQEARSIRRAEAGLVDNAHRADVVGTKAEDWLTGPLGKKFEADMATDPSFLSIRNALGRQVPDEIVLKLKDAKGNPEAIREIMLNDVLGLAARDTTDIGRVRGPSLLNQSRLAANTPQQFAESGWNTTYTQRLNSVNNVDAWLINNGVKDLGQRSKLVEQWARALETNKQDRYKALADMWQATRESLVAAGVPENWARDLTNIRDDQKVGAWGLDRAGRDSDFGFAEQLRGGGHVISDASSILQADGPMVLSEGLGDSVHLGDIRAMRRLTSKWGWLTAVKDPESARYGQLRIPWAVIDHVQEKYLRPAATARPALTLRVIGDEQFSIAANGLTSMARHPLQHIMLAMHRGAAFDSYGRDFDELAKLAGDSRTWDDYGKSLKVAYRQGGVDTGRRLPDMSSHFSDPLAAEAHSFRTGDLGRADKARQPQLWLRGFTESEMNKLRHEPVSVMMAQNKTNEEIKAWLASNDEIAVRNRREIEGLLANKSVYDQTGKRAKTYLNAKDPGVLDAYLDAERRRLATAVGSDPDMVSAIAHNIVGKEEVTVLNTDIRPPLAAGPRVEADPFNPGGGASTWIGSRVKLPDGRIGIVVNDANEAGHSIVQIGAAAYDASGRPSKQMLAAADRWRQHELSPQLALYPVRAEERVGAAQATERMVNNARDHAVSAIFRTLYTRPSDWLSNSPVFRQLYYKRMTEMAANLAPEEASKFLHSMQAAADMHAAGNVAQFLGSNKLVDQAIEAAKGASGTVTHAQLDAYAKGWALDMTKKVLYDASRRRQLADVARIVFPFGQHWGNFVARWTRNVVANPAFARRGQLLIQGGKDLDPTGSGQGFFHRDPRTGKEVFTYPYSAAVSRWLTGGVISQDQNEPLQGLSMGLQPFPGVGWVASMAAGAIIPDKPQFDEVKRILQPYGSGFTVAPWASKIYQGIVADPNSGRIYANTLADVMQNMAASGKYGNSPQELERLRNDARDHARILTIFRGVLQMAGPAAPSNDYHVITTQGDKMASGLIKEYAKMIEADPQHATANFDALYGDAMMAYTVGKTRATRGGLETSTAFGDWEREHPSLFAQTAAPDVAGFFAPSGTDLDLAVRSRQLASGRRVNLTPDEWQSAVNETIGNLKYYALRDGILAQNERQGITSMNQAQRDYLTNERRKIDSFYPVPNPRADTRVDFAHQISQLQYAVGTPELANNDVAGATRTYLDLRDKVLQLAKDRGFKSLDSPVVSDLRAYLLTQGTKITDHTPAFGRLWSRVLSKEVD